MDADYFVSLIQGATVWIIPVILAITLHEAAHGWAASRLGDPTARLLGRVTLNPLAHIDLFGTLILPAMLLIMKAPFLFGYAKPVPVNFSRLNNPRRDMALVALAGPQCRRAGRGCVFPGRLVGRCLGLEGRSARGRSCIARGLAGPCLHGVGGRGRRDPLPRVSRFGHRETHLVAGHSRCDRSASHTKQFRLRLGRYGYSRHLLALGHA